jgi:two-component system chemotaxis response regulator CheB
VNGPPSPTRVLVVDDSATVRAVLRRIISRSADLEVAGEACDGVEAVAAAARLAPDVILMDVAMPNLDGTAATERIMATRPIPILVITSKSSRREIRSAFESVCRGALEIIPKPESAEAWTALARALPETIRALAAAPDRSAGAPVPPAFLERRTSGGGPRWIAVAASTGGPAAVRAFLDALPDSSPATVLLVQHIAAGFEEGLADWLHAVTHRDVRVACDGERPAAGAVRVAPAGAHLRVSADGRLELDGTVPPRSGHRPSADELFLSCAEACPRETVGIVMTGMGSDGATGLLALRRAGGATFVQDERSSAVFGMPRAALAVGAAEVALPPAELGRAALTGRDGAPP